MDAFFVPISEYDHPYSLRLWCTSTFEGSSYLMTFDGVKIRLYNFLSHRLIKEVDFLKHEALSYVIPVYHHNFPSKAIFVMVRDRRNLMAWDDSLTQIPPLAFDTSLVILAMVWSPERSVLYISGNFGWIRALEMKVQTSISGTVAEWVPKWTKHDSGQWMTLLTLDETREMLFGASGVDVFIWSITDGQLLMKFPSLHSMAISSIRYSSDHLMFFTASADGSIKSWRINEREAMNVQTLKQTPLGPFLIDIDPKSIICISHERILRRYNMLTGSLLGQLDLDSSVPLENKNLDNALKLNLAFIGRRNEYLFESEGGKIRSYEVHYAPRELAICCEIVSNIGALQDGRIIALCSNNIIHVLYTDGTDNQTIDLDRLPIANMPNSRVVPATASRMIIQGNLIYFGFETGEIKLLDIDRNELFEMREPDIGNPILSVCPSQEMLCKRHVYCNKTAEVSSLLFSCAANGGFTIHCPLCYHFIASWKLNLSPVLQLQQIEGRHLLIGIDKQNIRIWKPDEQTLHETASINFDENETSNCFAFAAENIIIVGLSSGKCAIYELIFSNNSNEKGENKNINNDNSHNNNEHNHSISQIDNYTIKIVHKYNVRLHNCPISKIISCRDLLKIDGASESFQKENLNGIVCSIGHDDSFRIIDCFTGIIQYRSNLPAHISAHSACFAFQGKIIIALSIDKNIRLFDWPSFPRVVPTPPSSPKRPRTPQDKSSPSGSDDEEEDFSDSMPYFPTSTTSHHITAVTSESSRPVTMDILQSDSLNNSSLPASGQNVNANGNSGSSNTNGERFYFFGPPVPKEERKKMSLVFENGYPKLVIKGEEPPPAKVEFQEEYYLNDIIQVKENKNFDDVLNQDQAALNKLLKEDPEIARAFQTKPLKKIKYVNKEKYDDEQFFDNFLTLTTKPLLRRRKKKPQHDEEEEVQERHFETPQEILPIGGRRRCRRTKMFREGSKRAQGHVIVIEFKDGTKLYTNKITIDILKKIATLDDDDGTHIYSQTVGSQFVQLDKNPKELTPGFIFSQAINELNEKQEKRRNWKPLVRKTSLVATPIITMTEGGISIGGSKHRSFNNKDDGKYDEIYNNFMNKINLGQLDPSKFMHWEGVLFGTDSLRNASGNDGAGGGKKIAKIFNLSEEFPNEYDYDEDEEANKKVNILDELFNQFGPRPMAPKSNWSDDDEPTPFNPSDYFSIDPTLMGTQGVNSGGKDNQGPNSSSGRPSGYMSTTIFGDSGKGPSGFNIFDEQNEMAHRLIDSSPSLKKFTDIIGNSENPLLDLINQQTAMTREQINKQTEAGRIEGLNTWHKLADIETPHFDNTFKFEGLSDKIQKMDMIHARMRPASPRPMDALANITNKMNFGGQPLLPVISETSFSEFSEDSEDISFFNSRKTSAESSPRNAMTGLSQKGNSLHLSAPQSPRNFNAPTPQMSIKNAIINEHLQRNDFKGLKDLLTDVGLFDNGGLIDLPRWQPTVNFLTHHQKAVNSSQPLNIDLEKWISEGALKSSSSIHSAYDAIGSNYGSQISFGNQNVDEDYSSYSYSYSDDENSSTNNNGENKENGENNGDQKRSHHRSHHRSETNDGINENVNGPILNEDGTINEQYKQHRHHHHHHHHSSNEDNIENGNNDSNDANVDNKKQRLNENNKDADDDDDYNDYNLSSDEFELVETGEEEDVEVEVEVEKEIIDENGNKRIVKEIVKKVVRQNVMIKRKIGDPSGKGVRVVGDRKTLIQQQKEIQERNQLKRAQHVKQEQRQNRRNNTQNSNKNDSNGQKIHKGGATASGKSPTNSISRYTRNQNRISKNNSNGSDKNIMKVGSKGDIEDIERLKDATSIIGVAPRRLANGKKDAQGRMSNDDFQRRPKSADEDEDLYVKGDKKTVRKPTARKRKKKTIIDKGPASTPFRNKKGVKDPLLMHHKSDENLLVDYEDDINNVDLSDVNNIRNSYDNLLEPVELSPRHEEEEEFWFEEEEEEEEWIDEDGNSQYGSDSTNTSQSRPGKNNDGAKGGRGGGRGGRRARIAEQKRTMRRRPIIIDDEDENEGNTKSKSTSDQEKSDVDRLSSGPNNKQPSIVINPPSGSDKKVPPKIEKKPIPSGQQSASNEKHLPPKPGQTDQKPAGNDQPRQPYFTGILKSTTNKNARPQRTIARKGQTQNSGSSMKLSRNPSNNSFSSSHKSINSSSSEKLQDVNVMSDIIEEAEHTKQQKTTDNKRNGGRKSLGKRGIDTHGSAGAAGNKKKKPNGLPGNYDAAREYGINKGLNMKHEDEDALFDQLMKNTTLAEPISNLSQLGEKEVVAKKSLIRPKTPDERITSLGTKVALYKHEPDFDSLKLIPRKEKVEIMDDLFLSNLKMLGAKPYGSQCDVHKTVVHQKKQIYMFSKVDIAQAPAIFYSHYAPPLWDKKLGKLRRTSF